MTDDRWADLRRGSRVHTISIHRAMDLLAERDRLAAEVERLRKETVAWEMGVHLWAQDSQSDIAEHVAAALSEEADHG